MGNTSSSAVPVSCTKTSGKNRASKLWTRCRRYCSRAYSRRRMSIESEKSAAHSSSDFDEKKPHDEHEDIPTLGYQRTGTTAVVTPDDMERAYIDFVSRFPEYRLTTIIDTLRATDFTRLASNGETYVDYMGGALYPERLLTAQANFLKSNVLGNTHSINNSSRLSSQYADEARRAILDFFGVPNGYTVIFTSNATGALKLVGESFPFVNGSALLLGEDSHNSVHGIREFATHRGATVHYIASTRYGGLDIPQAEACLNANQPAPSAPSLFVMTAQSNITNSKNPLSLLQGASRLGYFTMLDAAALAPTSMINLEQTPVDAMAVSFYKMFGYPTGIGALIIRSSFLTTLQRPWFAGGNVDFVQVPGHVVTRSPTMHEQFEDGTCNYLQLAAITEGLRFLSPYLPLLPLRLSPLTCYLAASLSSIRHDTSQTPVVKVLSRVPSKRTRTVGDQSDAGSTLSMIFLAPNGTMLPNVFIEHAASVGKISLRTGCMCNTGGAAAMLNLRDEMGALQQGVTRAEFEERIKQDFGVVRMSLGLASSFEDVWAVLEFAKEIANESQRQRLWSGWQASQTEAFSGACLYRK